MLFTLLHIYINNNINTNICRDDFIYYFITRTMKYICQRVVTREDGNRVHVIVVVTRSNIET